MDIYIDCEIIQDASFDHVASLDSLVELEYTTRTPVGRFLPFLKLPHLKRLQVFSTRLEKLADLLPHSGHILLSGATTLSYSCNGDTQEVKLSGKGFNASFRIHGNRADIISAEWFSDEKHLPFGQIEEVGFTGSDILDFPIHLFKNAKKYRAISWDGPIAESAFPSLCPCPGAGVPCPSLRVIEYAPDLQYSSPESCLRPLINLARERERAGYRLELLEVMTFEQLDPYFEEELRKHVGEFRVCIS